MVGFAKWCGTGALNLVWLLPLLALFSGQYSNWVSWRDHRVTVQIAQNINVKDVAENLSHEDFRQINCLAVNMYFEAGNQGQTGMAAVGDVVFNRLKSGVFPDRICQVVTGGKRDTNGKLLNGCEFSWMCDGKKHEIANKAVYAQAYEVAYNQYLYREKMPDITAGATYYHADYVAPHTGIWKHAEPLKQIGAHIFYKPGGGEDFHKRRVDKTVSLR